MTLFKAERTNGETWQHPKYQPVVFRDTSTGDEYLTRSTATSTRTVTGSDGQTYPLPLVNTSSYSHPFWTGHGRVMDTEGRVERFRRRYGTRTDRASRTDRKESS